MCNKNREISGGNEWFVQPLTSATAGYDIKSYEKVGEKVKVKKIEVKSTVASPLRFYLTKNEWKQALSSDEGVYVFHIWDLSKSPPILHIRTVSYVEKHVPTNNEKGEWKIAEIPLGHEIVK